MSASCSPKCSYRTVSTATVESTDDDESDVESVASAERPKFALAAEMLMGLANSPDSPVRRPLKPRALVKEFTSPVRTPSPARALEAAPILQRVTRSGTSLFQPYRKTCACSRKIVGRSKDCQAAKEDCWRICRCMPKDQRRKPSCHASMSDCWFWAK